MNTETLTAGSCIARTNDTEGSFIVTGGEGLPQPPEKEPLSPYPTGMMQAAIAPATHQTLQEPGGIFQLADGLYYEA